MLKLVALCLALACAQAATIYEELNSEEFNLFKLKYGKVYKDQEEELYRMNIFNENRHFIAKHNQLYHQGLVTFDVTMNKFGDMDQAEFNLVMNGLLNLIDQPKGSTYLSPDNVVIPNEIDWRTQGYVTEVKDQGHCGSCYAFSVTGALEGQTFRKTKSLVSLSEQNIIDCTCEYGNQACGGGYMGIVYTYIEQNGGIDTEASYPYQAQAEACSYNASNIGATGIGYAFIQRNNESQLTEAIATVGPISIGIDASHRSFKFYKSGVYYERSCSSTANNHAVLAVGYGTDKVGGDYYIVKNSWGKDFGNDGYILMARNRNNHCGIARLGSYPFV